VSAAVAKAVALQAQADGMADKCDAATLDERIAANVWEPRYRPYRRTA
jgi:malic enzyme